MKTKFEQVWVCGGVWVCPSNQILKPSIGIMYPSVSGTMSQLIDEQDEQRVSNPRSDRAGTMLQDVPLAF